MATLQGTKIKDTYPGLLKSSDNAALGAVEKEITDGDGNSSTLKLGTTSASFVGTLDLSGATITGLTLGSQIGTHRTQATGEAGMDFGQGLILAPNTAVVVEYDTGTGGLCEIDCIFHFETIGFS